MPLHASLGDGGFFVARANMSDAELLALGFGPIHGIIIGGSLGFIVFFLLTWPCPSDDPDKQV